MKNMFVESQGFEADFQQRLRNRFPILKSIAYLDNGATTQKPQQVIDALTIYYTSQNANIHRGIYKLSEEATKAYERVRARTARFIGCHPSEIVFTSGTTDSLNQLARMLENRVGEGDEILVSLLEHHSNLVPWQQLAKRVGATVRYIGITDEGALDLADLRDKLSGKTKILAITQLSNVLGTRVDVKGITKLAHQQGALIVVDGAQAVAHQQVDVRDLDCDFYVFSSHKMYGPTGVGVLYGKKDLLELLEPARTGGGMISEVTTSGSEWAETPFKFEAGTPNIAGVVGLGEAITFLQSQDLDALGSQERALTRKASEGLSAIPGVKVLGPADKGPVLSFVIEGVHAHDVASILDEQDVAVRAGHHCAMPLMQRLGLDATTRASFALYNTEEDVERLIAGVKKAVEVFR